MKKFIFSMVMFMMTVFSMNAQVAYEAPKLFDNVYVGVQGGVTTPLDFNSVFPLNSVAGLKVGKQLTPVFGVEAEGNVFFNDNNFIRWTNTFVKGTNVGLNGTVNLTNLFAGYNGAPRTFEVKTNTGLGWVHYWNAGNLNGITGKTALDFDFNLGKTKAHTISVTPGVFWNLMPTRYHDFKFDKRAAQLGVMVGYTYHFKTSNGTHVFKLYDVGGMERTIADLNAELAKKPGEVVKEVRVVSKDVETVNETYVVQFAQNSSLLTGEFMDVLNKIPTNVKVDVVGSASVEGTAAYNKKLSEDRANAVASYLRDRGVTVCNVSGVGATNGPTSNRLVVVTVVK